MTTAVETNPAAAAAMRALVDAAVAALNQIILGKDTQVRLCLACLLARGHLLIEDIPGVGKTTLAHALAHSLGLSYQRIQFTSDLLPADIIGVSVFEADSGQFRFHRGPVFAQLVLADEVNRATPKAQSALLEAMEEHQVTADGQTYPLTEPFFVIATQNPAYQVGTYPLPESQLDRFLMRIELGYPAPSLERQLLLGRDRRDLLAALPTAHHAAAAAAAAGGRAAGARFRGTARLRAGRARCTRARRRSSRPGCRRAPSSRCCGPRRRGPSCTATTACCRRTCRRCCRPWSGTGSHRATMRASAARPRSGSSCWLPSRFPERPCAGGCVSCGRGSTAAHARGSGAARAPTPTRSSCAGSASTSCRRAWASRMARCCSRCCSAA